jgi:RHS repeat-associated protein
MRVPALRASSPSYSYAGVAYANPNALTMLSSGYSTTTYVYDNNGNVIQKTTDGTTTTYVYDYANRLTALGVLGATTTYAYDAFGQRVLQTGTTTTYLYPFKWYSVASSTGTGAKFATTTDYVFNGDSLVATIDQQTASGNATGTAKTRYIHPDHLGSTNLVTDENDNVVQTLDFYPYGSTRISVATSTNERRQYIGQFTDDSTLSYLQARYYDSARGQFLSEDPVFTGEPKAQNLPDPQSLNAYSYSEDNPITKSDPTGRCGPFCIALVAMLTPSPVGDPVFGANGSISSTPQQAGIDIAAFAGQAVSGTEEATALSRTTPAFLERLTTSIGARDEVTDLPVRVPSNLGGKVIFGLLGTTAFIGALEEYFSHASEAGNDYGGLATYNLMPHPQMVNNLTPYSSGGTGPAYLYAPDFHTACGILCYTPTSSSSNYHNAAPTTGSSGRPRSGVPSGSTSGNTAILPADYHSACGTPPYPKRGA